MCHSNRKAVLLKKIVFVLLSIFATFFCPPEKRTSLLCLFLGSRPPKLTCAEEERRAGGSLPRSKKRSKASLSSPHVALLFAPRKKSRAKGRRRDGHPNSIRHSQGSFLPLHPPITLQVRDSSNYQPISVFSYWTFVVSWLVYFVMKISHKL